MRRREFITLLGGAAVAWPLAGRAQQVDRMRRIGILLPAAAGHAEFQAWVAAFLQALALLGWTIGRNVRIDTRWAGANAADIHRHAGELAGWKSTTARRFTPDHPSFLPQRTIWISDHFLSTAARKQGLIDIARSLH